MIKIEKWDVVGFEPAIRGMRNPMNSWVRSDSEFGEMCCDATHDVMKESIGYGPLDEDGVTIGPNDLDLMARLSKGGPVHAKYRRMIVVYADIIAPLYWWKEFDTYKVGTVANSCSTMHKIHEKEFTLDDFSHEHLLEDFTYYDQIAEEPLSPKDALKIIINNLNKYRKMYIEYEDKEYWWQMIQLLPSSYNQKGTVMLNYEVLNNIRNNRSKHKLNEWREFCKWTDTLPYISDICPYGGINV